MPSSEHTPYAGMSSVSASVAAVTRPTRSPVNGPGPTPTTTAPRSRGLAPACASTASSAGASSSPCARASTVTRSATSSTPVSPTVASAAVIAGVAESITTMSTSPRIVSGAVEPCGGQPGGPVAGVGHQFDHPRLVVQALDAYLQEGVGELLGHALAPLDHG